MAAPRRRARFTRASTRCSGICSSSPIRSRSRRRSASRTGFPPSSGCRFAKWLRPMRRSCWRLSAISTSSNNLAASDMAPLRILVNGAQGRMGKAIIACAKLDPGFEVVAQVDANDDFDAGLEKADAVIEFSHHAVTAPVARACAAAGKLLVIGTTGHTDAETAQIRAASATIPIVFAPNFSVGVNALFWLTEKAAEILGPDFDLEVVE